MQHKAYRFKIEPTKEQKNLLARHFGCVRVIYNKLLEEKQQYYLNHKETLSYSMGCAKIVDWKKTEEYKWLKEVNAQSLQQSAMNLETAYINFFKGRAKFPKFKSKFNRQSFKVPQSFKVKDNKLFIPKFREGIRIKLHRQIKGKIKSVTIIKTPSDKYFASILCEENIEHKPKTKKEIGLDLGIKDFVILSNGKKYKNQKFLNKYEKELEKAQKHLSRKQKGSNRYRRQRLKVARIHEKIANSRRDFLHKVSTELVSQFDFIAVESLKVKNMVKNHHLAKAISDCAWGTFVRLLEYKCEWYGKQLVKISQWYPSSKTCHHCDYINSKLKLSDRKWTCPKCGEVLDRDINAAKNIYRAGRTITDMEKKALASSYKKSSTSSDSSETSFCEVSKVPSHSEVEAPSLLACG